MFGGQGEEKAQNGLVARERGLALAEHELACGDGAHRAAAVHHLGRAAEREQGRVDVARGGRGADAAAERAAVADLRAADLTARHGKRGKILPHERGLRDLRMHAHRADGERIAGQFNLLELLHLRQAQNSVRVPDLSVALGQKVRAPGDNGAAGEGREGRGELFTICWLKEVHLAAAFMSRAACRMARRICS